MAVQALSPWLPLRAVIGYRTVIRRFWIQIMIVQAWSPWLPLRAVIECWTCDQMAVSSNHGHTELSPEKNTLTQQNVLHPMRL
ncbi:hypothetical protein PoB_005652800 [Plakobranchus ocellatus]|uniref:Secreted protein n=1 Tax=Plakobranchus ocellatus TaxID=259542 RepID=A0AAV4CDN4_9GAST|nr:hypothetical protein PoB_005652800 [Plakobranchus ocellatus]